MTPDEMRGRLSAKLGAELTLTQEAGDPHIHIELSSWKQACTIALSDPDLAFNFLRSLCGTDFPQDDKIEIAIHLFSYKHKHAIVLKTRTDRSAPVADSLSDVWPAAIWHEREVFDLLGVDFTGHPDLRRILLPEDWEGHPLRKDYVEKEFYNGIPTSRPGYEKKAAEEAAE